MNSLLAAIRVAMVVGCCAALCCAGV